MLEETWKEVLTKSVTISKMLSVVLIPPLEEVTDPEVLIEDTDD